MSAICVLGLRLSVLVLGMAAPAERGADRPYWLEAMRKVHAGFVGSSGTVAQFGDSITYSMAFWTPVGWMEPDAFLTGDDGLPKRPAGGRWRDTLKGMRAKGPENANYSGWRVGNLLEAAPAVLQRDRPEVAIVMIGTNNTAVEGPPPSFGADLEKLVRTIMDAHCIPILNSIPPKRGCIAGVENTNAIIRRTARKHNVPLVDYYAEIIERQPGSAWDGTLIDADGVHPTGGDTGDFSEKNLKASGYALRTWTNFLAVRQVYFRVLAPKQQHKQASPK